MIKVTFSECITYFLLYGWTIRNFGRLLRRFYAFHIPFTMVLEIVGTIALLICFLKILRKYEAYSIRLLLLGGITLFSLLI